MLFIMVAEVLILIHSAGLMNLLSLRLPVKYIHRLFRWWILPWCRMTDSLPAPQNGAVGGVNSETYYVRKRDLLGLIDQIVSLLVTGNTNDRQLKALFNYVLQTGDAQRFRAAVW